ncbi:MAG: 2-amino-4-hydroxy-6-hydroxymethyldihydropteridine diphosphokinase [Pseudanabaenaceae cyanobacterium bins.68]|nr:2-amino-4-hydroxy-6-hydroxymethyldihydropteridine diphosphokinase [Pseudanabaenaceae cyanobacterium bins.68]
MARSNLVQRCAIALGSNLGARSLILANALELLANHPAIEVVAVSRWYCSPAVTPSPEISQPDYLNGAAVLQTSLTPLALLDQLLQIETHLGRVRRDRWDARTLDLDLLLYGQIVLQAPELTLPHPRMCDRAFVLVPLAEIAADWVHPQAQQTIIELSEALPMGDRQQLREFKGNLELGF